MMHMMRSWYLPKPTWSSTSWSVWTLGAAAEMDGDDGTGSSTDVSATKLEGVASSSRANAPYLMVLCMVRLWRMKLW